MPHQLVIFGAGGFGREVLDVIDAINADQRRYEVIGFLDDGAPDHDLLKRYDQEVLGGFDYIDNLPEAVGYVIGIGAGGTRRRIAEHIGPRRWSPPLVHPTATMGREVDLEGGVIVCAHAALTTNIRIGRHVHVNLGCTIGHDAVLHDYVTLSPQVAISGNVTAEEAAFFGTGAVVNPGVTVGARAVVGSGAVVLKDVAPDTVVTGVPARPRQG